MKRRLGLRNLLVTSLVLMSLTSCSDEEFYQKDSYETFTDIYEKENPVIESGVEVLDGPGQVAPGDDISNDTPTSGDSGSSDGSTGDNGSDTGDNGGDTGDNGGDTGDNGGDTGDNGGDTGDNGGNTGDNGGDDDNSNGDDNDPQVVHKSESFVQTAELTKLDIVWVIDNSGSMADEQAAIAYNFDVFINDFIQKDVNFQMAITTTDTSSSYKAGKAVYGSMTALTSAKAKANPDQFLEDFADMIQVGTSGSGIEKGIYASAAFANRYGSNFFRDDAYLVIVYVSDEEDQSNNAVNSYMDYIKSFKTQSSMVKSYAIVDMSGAPSESQWDAAGYARYEEATQITGGYTSNIYGDFYTTLSKMGESIAKLSQSFALTDNPIASSIEVYVNGVLVNSGWSYDNASRTLTFADGSVPAAGSSIEVRYDQLP